MSDKKDIEKRKLQTTGGSTYIVSLPKKWVEEIKLESGDNVGIEKRGSFLMLYPAKLEEEADYKVKMEIEPDESPSAIKRKILSFYLGGLKTIKIEATDRLRPNHRKTIKDLARDKLVGTEIISETIEEITLQTLLSYSELSVEDALKRMYRVTSSMQENAMKALKGNDKEIAKDVIELDDEVDRFQFYLTRAVKASIENPSLLKKVGFNNKKEGLSYRLASKDVERAADHATHIAEGVLDTKGPIEKEILVHYTDMNSLSGSIFKKALDSLFEEDYVKAEEAIRERKNLYALEGELNNSLIDTKVSEPMSKRLIAESIRRIAEHGFNVAEISLNMSVLSENYISDSFSSELQI
ncbi:hypothetical protein AKJ51_02440 [candidate division MSBL1 archaeon SCGC-AAA382A20]|uniref:SpoVT-AbrB domain-containing protein n=1 Tax=candidate division MSBL1 archaeon SCGC-AAA382A20 TaxID=1698280 RepID=A0A133VKF8_9EURY|nr:hypothetical protein AKJ51_02440 [candidate division MSBL1 archaeon SCGC-AAA382A20]